MYAYSLKRACKKFVKLTKWLGSERTGNSATSTAPDELRAHSGHCSFWAFQSSCIIVALFCIPISHRLKMYFFFQISSLSCFLEVLIIPYSLLGHHFHHTQPFSKLAPLQPLTNSALAQLSPRPTIQLSLLPNSWQIEDQFEHRILMHCYKYMFAL